MADLDPEILNKFRKLPEKELKTGAENRAPGKIIRRSGTKLLLTENDFSETVNIPHLSVFEEEYTCCLELIYGIRGKKSAKFAECGIKTLHDASSIEGKKHEVSGILASLEKGFESVKHTLSARFSPSHRLFFLLLTYFSPSELLFIDIETKSLSFETSIIEIGAGYFENGKFRVSQFTALEDAAEYEVIEEFKKLLPGKKAFVTFNGRTFDIPFIDGRMGYYDAYAESDIMEMHNFDLLHFSRHAFRGSYESFRLKEIEKNILGKNRGDDIDGAEVEIYYNKFLRTRNFKYLEPIVYHNMEDIVSMAHLLNKLIEKWK